jgi:hypothetical protein
MIKVIVGSAFGQNQFTLSFDNVEDDKNSLVFALKNTPESFKFEVIL